MSKLVLPKTYFIGATALNPSELERYLIETDQEEFLEEIRQASKEGLNMGEVLCSFYAKACYASLTDKKNKNITKTRSIYQNLLGTIESGHGSVFEHCSLNFMITNCSRVFTHELVRHRVGTAFSQTSGRYVRSDELKIVIDPILNTLIEDGSVEEIRNFIEGWYNNAVEKLGLNEEKNFDVKKKKTSALRRLMPNGQANEMGFTVNLRTLRQTVEARTSRHAEWEIRLVFNQIFNLVSEKYPAIFTDSKVVIVDNLREITFKSKKI